MQSSFYDCFYPAITIPGEQEWRVWAAPMNLEWLPSYFSRLFSSVSQHLFLDCRHSDWRYHVVQVQLRDDKCRERDVRHPKATQLCERQAGWHPSRRQSIRTIWKKVKSTVSVGNGARRCQLVSNLCKSDNIYFIFYSVIYELKLVEMVFTAGGVYPASGLT